MDGQSKGETWYWQNEDDHLTASHPLAQGELTDGEVLTETTTKYGESMAQVALRWAVQHHKVLVISKSTDWDYLATTLKRFEFTLTLAEIEGITRPSLFRTDLAGTRAECGVGSALREPRLRSVADGIAVLSGFGGRREHAALVSHDLSAAEHRGRENPDVVALPDEFGLEPRTVPEAFLERQGTILAVTPPRGVQRRLEGHVVVDQVREHLDVPLGLHVPTHHPEGR
ncbi:MAG: hypothetical protein ACI8VE_002874, partial [Natrialbaceae archaeon]